MTGKIVKGIAGFYYVYGEDGILYECKAKGIFRNKKIKPLVGDNVEITVLGKDPWEGNIEQIKERNNTLIRPAVANIDQALVLFAMADPEPNLNLLDPFLVMNESIFRLPSDLTRRIYATKNPLSATEKFMSLPDIRLCF